ncbi:MAG: DM13 domain-containing protein [Cyanobacteria bacterium P01_A01_bin.17]
MAQNLMRKGLTGFAIATSLLVMACASEQVSSVPAPETSPTEQPAADAPAAAGEEKTGTFVSAEAPTSGTAKLVTQEGQTTIELGEAFKTSEQGPDLVVVLHKSADVVGETTPPTYPLNEGDYVYIADLEAFSGAQSYPVPQEIDASEYQSVTIWCRKFNATFGSAALQ